MEHVGDRADASTGPPLIGGGEKPVYAEQVPHTAASTGPPLIGGGEGAWSGKDSVTLPLQRVRR